MNNSIQPRYYQGLVGATVLSQVKTRHVRIVIMRALPSRLEHTPVSQGKC